MSVHFTRVGDEGSLDEWGLRGPAEELIPGSSIMATRIDGTEHNVTVGTLLRNNPRTGIAVATIHRPAVKRPELAEEKFNRVLAGMNPAQEFTTKEMADLCGMKHNVQRIASWLTHSSSVWRVGYRQTGPKPHNRSLFWSRKEPPAPPPPAINEVLEQAAEKAVAAEVYAPKPGPSVLEAEPEHRGPHPIGQLYDKVRDLCRDYLEVLKADCNKHGILSGITTPAKDIHTGKMLQANESLTIFKHLFGQFIQ